MPWLSDPITICDGRRLNFGTIAGQILMAVHNGCQQSVSGSVGVFRMRTTTRLMWRIAPAAMTHFGRDLGPDSSSQERSGERERIGTCAAPPGWLPLHPQPTHQHNLSQADHPAAVLPPLLRRASFMQVKLAPSR